MKNDLQNNVFSWPERLRSYDTVDNRITPKKETWEKLQKRLTQPQQRKKILWYRAAAASTIAFMLLSIAFMRERYETYSATAFSCPAAKNVGKLTGTRIVAVHSNVAGTGGQAVLKRTRPLTLLKDSSHQPGQAIGQPVKDSSRDMAADTQSFKRDMVQKPAALPVIHINDIPDKEVPPNISARSIGILKLIRLFHTDMTTDKPSKTEQQTPGNGSTNSINQN